MFIVPGKLSVWLLKEPVGGVILPIDKYILFFLRIIYLIVRIIARIFLGKKRRKESSFLKKISTLQWFSPTFFIMMCLFKLKKSLRLGNAGLVKLNVPKYDYKVYCPPTKDDFANMTIREEDILERFYPKEGDTVIDVGAHIGRYALIGSKRVGKRGKVISIEANPLVFEILYKNVGLNHASNIVALNYAVYSEQTKIKLFVGDDKLNYTIYNTIISNRAHEEKFVEVNADTLDSLLLQNKINFEDVNWIKIDVEGAEFEVLKGATNVLSKSKDISILIEIHNIEEGKNFYKEIMDFLGNYNFKIDFEKAYESGEKHVLFQRI
jgi:FkbM family methyltransferase